MTDLETSCMRRKVLERCHRIKLKVTSDFSRQQVHNTCIHTINSMGKSDCLSYLMDAFAAVDNAPIGNPASTESEVPVCDQQRILVSNTKKAFTWTYNGEHALTAFLEYLDVQWLKMIDEWDPSNGGTLQSRCGSIIQSSCAGKSRLIDR